MTTGKYGTRFSKTTIDSSGKMGFWNPPAIPTDAQDFSYVITVATSYRPDKISKEVYGTEIYDWVILYYNGITDPFKELTPNTVLKIPTRDTVNLML